ncbi:MAG: RNA methyltransferase [Alphaproteobacteria bacterium]|nr:RNA methyltransferase [Alphaproteobacteria bacterium]
MTVTLPPPCVILVRPQLGQNIGMAARAMANFGLSDLRIVAPREGWPNEWAIKAASGADWVLEDARLFDTVEAAVADIHYLVATTARLREMLKPVVTAEAAAREMRTKTAQGLRCGIMFGPERSGLENDDATLAQAVLRIPVDPRFTSINLAQAVLLTGYEWFRLADTTPPERFDPGNTWPASNAELVALFEHLERELDTAGFLFPPEKRPAMVRNLRNIFMRAGLMEQDVRALRGVVTSLATARVKKEQG